jgi:tetratricopeptide (TPR) repeat protein
MGTQLTDGEKQQLLAILFLHKVYAPGLDRLALRIAESISDKDRESAMLTVSYYLAASGNTELAEEVARQRLAGYSRCSALIAIGSELAKTDKSKAKEFQSCAEGILEELSDPDERTILLARISDAYLKLGDWEKAEDFARRIAQSSEKISALCAIAEHLLNVGEATRANEVVEEAQTDVASVTEEGERASTLADTARVLAKIGRTSEAVEFWEQAAVLAHHAPDPSKLLLSICQSLVNFGEPKRARSVAMRIQNEALRAEALTLSTDSKNKS